MALIFLSHIHGCNITNIIKWRNACAHPNKSMDKHLEAALYQDLQSIQTRLVKTEELLMCYVSYFPFKY
jgi:hypothetical protein